MTAGIMQPYFYPYLGYFQLIAATDKWIVFDTPQYIRHGWINRNRVLKYDGSDWIYVNVPLQKHNRETTIRDIKVSAAEDWRSKIIAQLMPYKKRAPFYRETMEVFEKSVGGLADESIVSLNVAAMREVCGYLGIPFHYEIYSAMKLVHEEPKHAGEWALHICRAIGADRYINPPGGREIFQPQQFRDAQIELLFLEPALVPYDQKNQAFIPGLSMIDVLMFNSPETIREMLANYKLTQ